MEKANVCGKRIKVARVKKDMAQVDLAAALNVDHGIEIDQGGVSNIERGDRYVKDFEIIALADVLDIHPMELLFGDKVPRRYK